MSETLKLPNDEPRKKEDSASLSKVKVCGYHTIDGNGKFVADISQLKYLKTPPSFDNVNFDLEKVDIIRRNADNPNDKKIDNFLRWILENVDKIKASPESNRWLEPEFVCTRGCLGMLFRTLFEEDGGWIISACKWRGTIYLCNFDTKETKNKIAELANIRAAWAWRFSFKQYLLSDAPDKNPDTSDDKQVDAMKQFRCIFTSLLGDHELLYSAEMDGVSSDKILEEPIDFNGVKFVELKLNQMLEEPRLVTTFYKHQLPKWWSQSYLVGADKVLCGFRTDDGIVKKLEYIKVRDIPDKSKGFWNLDECLNCCDDFLNFVKSKVKEDYDKCVYKFSWDPVQKQVTFETDNPDSEYIPLPDWFINEAEHYNSGRESV